MKREDVVQYADAAAGAVLGKPPFSFAKAMRHEISLLAQFLEQNAEIDAEGLYLFSCRSAGTDPIKPWAEIRPKMRAAFEVYRATYFVLLRFAKEVEAAEREAANAKAAGGELVAFGKRTLDERVSGPNDRVKLS